MGFLTGIRGDFLGGIRPIVTGLGGRFGLFAKHARVA
jgi:hypothetical protein